MWPSGRGLVPHPAAFQNFGVYNPGGNYPEIQNQQGTIFTTYPPHAAYSEQPLPASYSQQVSGLRWPQELMAGGMVPWDQNGLLQNRYRREESVLEYNIGEVVMVRCNQQKWLCGIIQRMSARGLWILIPDANVVVNVPLVLVPTHVLKMSIYSELQALPQPAPMWTVAITDNTGCRQALVPCVRPAHLSHRQLFHKLGCIECVICKTTVTSIEVVSPWTCSHQVHNYCLQLRMQHSSTSACPSCNEMGTSQPMPLPSTGDGSNLQRMPSTFTGIGSISELMPSPSTRNAITSPSNEQHQQWLDLQCACGFRGSIDSVLVGNMYAPIFCPNCHQPVNINPMMIGMQNREPFATMDLPRAYSGVEREILQRKRLRAQGFGWPLQSFSVPSRLDAIEEGSREGCCSTPPSPDQVREEREELSYLPSYLVALGETFENNISDPDVVALSSDDQNKQPSPSSRSPRKDGILTAPSPNRVAPIQNGQFSARSSLQDGVMPAPFPTQVPSIQNGQFSARSSMQDGVLRVPFPTQATPIQNGQSSARSSLQDGVLFGPSRQSPGQSSARISWQDGVLTAPTPTRVAPIQNGQFSAQSSMQDGVLPAPSPTQVTPIQNGQSSARSSLQDGVLFGPSRQSPGQSSARIPWQDGLLHELAGQVNARSSLQDSTLTTPSPTQVTLIQNRQTSARSSSQDGSFYAPPSSRITLIKDQELRDNVLIGPAASTHVKHEKLADVQEAIESPEKVLETETRIVAAADRQRLWRMGTEAVWTRRNFDKDSEESEEASSSNDFAAAAAPSTPPVYVNHFANFVKLAMASASTAEEILANASASASSSITDPPPLKSPTPAWVTPAPAFFTRGSALITEAPAIVTPARAFYSRAPALVTETPAVVTPVHAFFSRAPALVTEIPALMTETPAMITETPAVVTPVHAFFSRAPALVTEIPALMTETPAMITETPALVTEAPANVTPARAFFSGAAALITEPPAWVTNGGGASPAWITVIKDGVDSRKEDVKQWELDRSARKKEAEFF